MTNVLVGIDDSEQNAHVLAAALERAEREEGGLVAVHVMPRAVYQSRRRLVTDSRDLRRDGFAYTLAQARRDAETVADRAVRDFVGVESVPHVAIGAVGKSTPTLLAVAAEHDCGVVVLPRAGSWWHRLGVPDRLFARRLHGEVVRVPRPIPSPALEPERRTPAR